MKFLRQFCCILFFVVFRQTEVLLQRSFRTFDVEKFVRRARLNILFGEDDVLFGMK